MAQELDLDANGAVILKPVVGWSIGPVAETAVFLRLEYVESPAELRTGGKALQAVLTPQQALELAETLTRNAHHILSQRPAGKPN